MWGDKWPASTQGVKEVWELAPSPCSLFLSASAAQPVLLEKGAPNLESIVGERLHLRRNHYKPPGECVSKMKSPCQNFHECSLRLCTGIGLGSRSASERLMGTRFSGCGAEGSQPPSLLPLQTLVKSVFNLVSKGQHLLWWGHCLKQ